MYQGDPIPINPVRPDETMNSVFRIYRYAPDYPAFVGKDLTPGPPIELYHTGVSNPVKQETIILEQNIPNPCFSETTIRYTLAGEHYVRAGLYDLRGQKLIDLSSGMQKTGTHSMKLDVSRISPGLYVVIVEAGSSNARIRICVLDKGN
jgi:hypothetical protein